MAAPAIVGTSTGGITGSGEFFVTPPGGSAGYLAIAHWFGTQAELTAPSGWTLHEEGNFKAGDPQFCRYAIYVGSSLPDSSWNHGNATEGAAVAVVGYDGDITVHQSAGTNADNSLTGVCPSVTTTEAALIARLFFIETFPDPTSIGYPGSHPDGQIFKSQDSGGDTYNVAACHVTQGSGGATGTATYTGTGQTAYANRAHTLALTIPNPTAPVVDIGPDSWCVVDGTFGRIATEDDTGSAITAREWKVMSGPFDAGDVVGTDVVSTWIPTVIGSYVIRYTATNGIGATFDELNLEVGAAIEGPQNSLMKR